MSAFRTYERVAGHRNRLSARLSAGVEGSPGHHRRYRRGSQAIGGVPSRISRAIVSTQLLGAQCSGTLVLAKLGLLGGVPACTDLTSKPWVQEAGVEVFDQPFFAKGNVATAGGCLSSAYLAGWMIARLEGVEAAKGVLHYVAPVGEKDDYVVRAIRNIAPYLDHALVAG